MHLLKYIFPRQFGLHNVFTSDVRGHETSQPFKDYTLREQEIIEAERQYMKHSNGRDLVATKGQTRIPRRLRGRLMALVRKLQIRHSRCSYERMLRFYCPVEVSLCPSGQARVNIFDLVG